MNSKYIDTLELMDKFNEQSNDQELWSIKEIAANIIDCKHLVKCGECKKAIDLGKTDTKVCSVWFRVTDHNMFCGFGESYAEE